MRRVIFSLLFLLIIPEVRSQVICYEEAKRRAEEFFNHSERRERPLKSGSLACADTLLTICAPGESPVALDTNGNENWYYGKKK